MRWYTKTFNELSVDELYQILKLRIDVFVVEQNCVYADLDDKDRDPNALHYFAKQDEKIVCYMRILPPGCSYPDMPSFGRVVTHPQVRGSGAGHTLLANAVEILEHQWPDKICHISAQSHLKKYYQRQGFEVVTEEYLEDDIPHIGMERIPNSQNS